MSPTWSLLHTQEGTTEEDQLDQLVLTADGNIVLSGGTRGAYNDTLAGTRDVVAVKLDPSSKVLWRYQVNCPGCINLR